MSNLSQFTHQLENSVNLLEYTKHIGISANKHSMCLCVNHKEKKPSMLVKEDHVYCFSCGFYARAVSLTMIVLGIAFKEALNYLCDFKCAPHFPFGKQSQEEIDAYNKQRDREERFYHLMDETVKIYQLNENPYLTEKRGIKQEIIKELRIGSTNGNKNFLKEGLLKKGFKLEEFAPLLLNQCGNDFFQYCIIIPILKSNRVIGIYGRKYDDATEYKHLYLKTEGFNTLGIEQETTLYNFDNVKGCKEIVIVESVIDTLSSLSNGIENCTGIYGTQGFKEEHLKQLKSAKIERIYFALDGDEAGKKSAIKNGYYVEDNGLDALAILFPEGKDPNEYFLSGGNKKSFFDLPKYTPLQLALQEINPSLKGKEFQKGIEQIIERISTQNPLSWNNEIKNIKEHFKSENPSLNDLKSSLRKRIEQREFEEKRKEKSLVPVLANQLISSSLGDIFQDPNFSSLSVPSDFQISEKGISSIVMKGNDYYEFPVAHAPCIIKSMSSNIENGIEFRELSFKQNGKIKSLNVPREIICDQKKIIELSAQDFPVNSLNAKYIVKFLSDFEALNRSKLLQRSITHGLGHRYDSKGNLIFYLPQKTYGTDETVTFEGKGPGDFDYFQALKPKGSLEKWIKTIKKYCLPYKFVMFNLYKSFSVSLYREFNIQKSFITNYSRKTSSGKTTNNQVAASIYGNPAKLILQWQFVTHVGIEQIANLFNGIPIFLDDAHNADKNKVAEIIYIVNHGLGKARGNKTGGLQRTPTWITVLFSTSERILLEETKKEGAEARMWDFDVLPFDKEDDVETGELTRTIKRDVHENYGVAIAPFRDHIETLGNERLMGRYNDAYKLFSSKVTKGGKAHRQIENWAAALTAGILAEEVFHFGGDPLRVCTEIFEFYQQEGFSDQIQEAMEDYISWANANVNRYDISGISYEEPEKGFGERHGVKNPGEYIAVFPHLLKDFLVDQGYSYKAILRSWKDRGWIQCGKENFTVTVSFRNKNTRMIKIFWKIYNQI